MSTVRQICGGSSAIGVCVPVKPAGFGPYQPDASEPPAR
jgi:hypothetical protein